MRRLLVVVLLGAAPAAAEVTRDGDRLIDDDPAATCRVEHATPGAALQCPRHTRVRADRIELLTPIVFDFDKDRLRRSSFAVLDEVVAALTAHPDLRLEVQGHGHEEPYRARLLSRDRAQAVRAYLIEHGIAPERIEAQGYGDTVPLVMPSTPNAERINRRIELHVLR